MSGGTLSQQHNEPQYNRRWITILPNLARARSAAKKYLQPHAQSLSLLLPLSKHQICVRRSWRFSSERLSVDCRSARRPMEPSHFYLLWCQFSRRQISDEHCPLFYPILSSLFGLSSMRTGGARGVIFLILFT